MIRILKNNALIVLTEMIVLSGMSVSPSLYSKARKEFFSRRCLGCWLSSTASEKIFSVLTVEIGRLRKKGELTAKQHSCCLCQNYWVVSDVVITLSLSLS